MIQFERRLLFRLTTPEGMAQAIGADLNPRVFQQPLNQAACNLALQYWAEHQTVPTPKVIEHEFPGVKLDDDQGEVVGTVSAPLNQVRRSRQRTDTRWSM
jgi:hypothetical protein